VRSWRVQRPLERPRSDNGIALVVVLVLLVVMGLAASVAMRGAITHEKVINNIRLEASAQAHAEIALRFCEGQLLLGPANREAALQNAENLPALPAGGQRWTDFQAWAAARRGFSATAALHRLDPNLVAGAPAPECLVERMALNPGNDKVWVVTARGFSHDYREDVADSRILSGSVVWLQSFIHID